MSRVPTVWRNWWALTRTGWPASSRTSIFFCHRPSCPDNVPWAYGLAPSALSSIPGNSHGEPPGWSRPTWACWVRMVSAALALSGMSCSALTLLLAKRRQGQPTLSSMIGLKASSHASPPRIPVSMSTITRWRTVGLRMRARLASDSSWAMTNSGMKRGSASAGRLTSSS